MADQTITKGPEAKFKLQLTPSTCSTHDFFLGGMPIAGTVPLIEGLASRKGALMDLANYEWSTGEFHGYLLGGSRRARIR